MRMDEGGWPALCARRAPTIRLWSLDARSEGRATHPLWMSVGKKEDALAPLGEPATSSVERGEGEGIWVSAAE